MLSRRSLRVCRGSALLARSKSVLVLGDEEVQNHPTLRLAEDLDYSSRSVLYDHLMGMGRVRNRQATMLPKWALEGYREVVSLRSSGQLKRCLKKPIFANASHEELKRYREREIGWAPLEKGRNRVVSPSKLLLYGPEESVAYTKKYMPGRYAHIKRCLAEVRRLRPTWAPERMLDFGCGPGTALLAATETWGSSADADTDDGGGYKGTSTGGQRTPAPGALRGESFPIKKYVGIDMSRSMLDAAKTMVSTLSVAGLPLLDCTFWEDTASVAKRADRQGERYDLVVASYTLSELGSDQLRQRANRLLFELLSDDGVLLLVEDGSPKGSFMVRSARKQLLDFAPGTATVVAPCTHDGACPLGRGFWCSFAQLTPEGSTTSDKFSYVAISKRSSRGSHPNGIGTDQADESLLQTLMETRGRCVQLSPFQVYRTTSNHNPNPKPLSLNTAGWLMSMSLPQP
jgi:SAM-dependent methyltransferase